MSAMSVRLSLISEFKRCSIVYATAISLALALAYFQTTTGFVVVTLDGAPFPPLASASKPSTPSQTPTLVPDLETSKPFPIQEPVSDPGPLVQNKSKLEKNIVTSNDLKRRDTGEKTVMVGGAPMYPSKNIVENAVNSKDHTILVAAVKAAGLVSTLQGKGPFTVFAPTNAAFSKLPNGTVETLVKSDNKAMLTKILTYHVVAGKLEASDLTDGKKLTTLEGEQLTVKRSGDTITIVDGRGDLSKVIMENVNQTNGIIHIVDTVLWPQG